MTVMASTHSSEIVTPQQLRGRVQRLLRACKRQAVDLRVCDVYKFQFMISRLHDDFTVLERDRGDTTDDMMAQFRTEIKFLIDTLNAKKLVCLSFVLALFQSRSDDTYLAMSHLSDRTLTAPMNTTIHASDIVIPTSSTSTMTPNRSTTDVTLRNVRANQRAQSALEMRRELLGAKNITNFGQSIQSRTTTKSSRIAEEPTDTDALVARQHEQQEQLAQQFLTMTRNLKENVTVAGHVIRSDNQTIDRVALSAEQNRMKLERESVRLARAAYQSCCDCGLVCVILMSVIMFIVLVVFMRIFPKPSIRYETVNTNINLPDGVKNEL